MLGRVHEALGIPAPLVLLGGVSLVVGTVVCCLALGLCCLLHPRGRCRGRRRNRKRVRVVEDAADFEMASDGTLERDNLTSKASRAPCYN